MLAVALVVTLTADIGVVIRSASPTSSAQTEVMDRRVERGSGTAPRVIARKAAVPARRGAPLRQRAPAVFSSGGAIPAEPPVATSGVPAWIERQGQAALAQISYPWRDLGFTVSFTPARRGLRAVTYARERRIVVFVRRGEPVAQTAFDLAHEIGHAFDLTHGTWSRRRRWIELRGLDPSTPWFGCSGCDDLTTGSGDLAEVFALWQAGPVDFASRVAPAPSSAELARLVELFDPAWTSRDDPTRERSSDQAGSGTSDDGTVSRGDDGADDGQPTGGGPGEGDRPEDDGGDGGDGEDDEGDEDRGGPLPCAILCSG